MNSHDRTQPKFETALADQIEREGVHVYGTWHPEQTVSDMIVTALRSHASLNARIKELESNERAYEEILGKRTYREVADRIKELETQLEQALRQWRFYADEHEERNLSGEASLEGNIYRSALAALEAKHD